VHTTAQRAGCRRACGPAALPSVQVCRRQPFRPRRCHAATRTFANPFSASVIVIAAVSLRERGREEGRADRCIAVTQRVTWAKALQRDAARAVVRWRGRPVARPPRRRLSRRQRTSSCRGRRGRWCPRSRAACGAGTWCTRARAPPAPSSAGLQREAAERRGRERVKKRVKRGRAKRRKGRDQARHWEAGQCLPPGRRPAGAAGCSR
jgi:hypothetical protein